MRFATERLIVAALAVFSVAVAAAQPARPPSGQSAAVRALVSQHGEGSRARIERGVRQAAAVWRPGDGDLAAFAREQFVAEGAALDALFARLQSHLEQLDGHFLEMRRELRRPADLDTGPLLPVDALVTGYDPEAHLVDDLFANKVAFVALLNFPLATLDEKLRDGKRWTRRRWAEARLSDRFGRRVPAPVHQAMSVALSAADLYVADYNIWMHHLRGANGERLFPKEMKLISHWNLRDELKAQYANPGGEPAQQLILKVMERIVDQSIPRAVIDNPHVDWNPFTNQVTAAPAGEIEDGAPARPLSGALQAREPDVRYARLLDVFKASRKADPYSPSAPTQIRRAFDFDTELPEARVTALLTEVLASPLVPRVKALIEQRLGRTLQPQDLWYNGFVPRGQVAESELDARARARYPTADAYARDMPRMFEALGFTPERARFLAERIEVDPSRGAGHAQPAARRGDKPRLRTRVGAGGMDYKGYNIAVHEMGHSAEQVFSLYGVDHTLLAGVPNTAFTEALAFVFQAQDLPLLGYAQPDAASERLRVLNDFWQTWEIAGVALVDIRVWHWMYEHPAATPAALREATLAIAREVWNRYYAPVLGARDSVLLGIYSHMISNPLYLFNYPLGHLIAFQIEEHMRTNGPPGREFERMASYGAVTPDLWMEHATGAPVSAAPLLRATETALAP
jgi:hypothetical protein